MMVFPFSQTDLNLSVRRPLADTNRVKKQRLGSSSSSTFFTIKLSAQITQKNSTHTQIRACFKVKIVRDNAVVCF